MGEPKKQHDKVEGPRSPWNKERIEEEMVQIGTYGLRSKRELWRSHTELKKYRQRARRMLALPEDVREQQRRILAQRLYRLGLIEDEDAPIDAVLSLTADEFLRRRLQTIIFDLGFAKTIYQARQLIVHGHISIDGRKVKTPGYHVARGEEERIKYSAYSPLTDEEHPARRLMMEDDA